MAESVLLVSSDPLLGSSIEALAGGRLHVARVDPSQRPAAWPGKSRSTVVLDLAAKDRAATYPWVRQHHTGRVVVLLWPGEQEASLPPDPDRLVLRRPLGLSDLVEILAGPAAPAQPTDRPPVPPAARPPAGPEPATPEVPQADLKERRLRPRPQPRPRPTPARPTPTATPRPAAAPDVQAAPATKPTARSRPTPTAKEAPRKTVRPEVVAASRVEVARPPDGDRAAAVATPRPSPSLPAAGGRLGVWPWRRSGSRPNTAVVVVLGVILGLVVVLGGWLTLGLLQTRDDLRAAATGFRSELAKAKEQLGRGDPAAATASIQAASRDLDAAEATTTRLPMRVAARVPVLSGSVSDVKHLLAASRNLTNAGDRAVAVSVHLQSGRFAVLKRGRFDLGALNDAIGQAKGLVDELDRVRAELAQVRGGPLAPGADETKRWALEQLDQAVARARPVVPTLEALPAALGAGDARTYLVVLTNPAELRPGGGAPLAVVEVVMDKGAVEVRTRAGEIAENIHNAQTTWTAAAGDPWASGGRFTMFSLANSSPHFPTSGQELLRAYAATGRPTPDGVITLDPLAMRAVLRTTGPVTVLGYGLLTADNCVQQTTHDAYVRWPSREQRRRYNEELLGTLVKRLLSGRDLVATGKVLGTAGARRQMQIYAADPALQRVLAGNRMYGGLSPAGNDYLGVFTLNSNGSRMDYFQHRSIHQLVQLRPDGSAEVTRTIEINNQIPPNEPIQDGAETGYLSGRVAAVLANYLPPGATLEQVARDGRPVRPSVTSEAGRPLVRVNLDLAPGQSASFTVRYLTRKPTAVDAGFGYRLTADPQVLVRAPGLRIDVVAPAGRKISAAPGWAIEGATVTLSRPFTETVDSTIDVRR